MDWPPIGCGISGTGSGFGFGGWGAPRGGGLVTIFWDFLASASGVFALAGGGGGGWALGYHSMGFRHFHNIS